MLRLHPHRVIAVAALVALTLSGMPVKAAPPAEQILPETTVAFVSFGNWPATSENWNRTDLAELMRDPVMDPFTEDLRNQLSEKLDIKNRLGITWDDIEGLPQGELAVGLVFENSEPSLVLLADVKGQEQRASQVLSQIGQRLTEQNATRSTLQVGNVEVVTYEIAQQPGEMVSRRVNMFLSGDLLGISDHITPLRGILTRASGNARTRNLTSVEAYQRTMQRCQQGAGSLVPDARWFVEPFGCADASRMVMEPEMKRGRDMLKILRNQGFTAVKGMGGYVNLGVNDYELLHRTSVYAPRPYTLAMRMMEFPNGGNLTPQAWVPLDVATYATLHIDTQNAFQHFGTIFDEMFGEGETGVWEDVLESFKTDPNGPLVDIEKELVGNLGTRVSAITDYTLPVSVDSQRRLIAIEATNERALAQAIFKSVDPDPNAERIEFRGFTLWKIEPEEIEPPVNLEVEVPGVNAADVESEMQSATAEELLPSSAIGVAHGHLFLATDVELIKDVIIKQQDESRTLAEAIDYQQVVAQTEALGATGGSAMIFARTDEGMRTNYELVRTNQMPQAETGLARLLNVMLGEKDATGPRERRLDGSKLPEFQVVRRYLGPAGIHLTSENDGWYAVGFMLRKGQGTTAAEPAGTAAR